MGFKRVFLLLILAVFYTVAYAQTGKMTVRGSVTDVSGEKLVGAHLSFVPQGNPDSKTDVLSDNNGVFDVQLAMNIYTLRVTYTGYAPYEAQVECFDSISMPPIVLRESSSELAGVEIKADRIKYNTKGYAANLANDPLFKTRTLADAMQMLPGLYFADGEFHAYGEKIGSVFVNNKRIMFKESALVSYLATLQAKNIVSVEVLNSTADPMLTDKMAFVVKITTSNANDGGNATIGAYARASNTYEFQMAPTFNIQQRIGKWSMFLSPSYTPRSMLNRGSKETITYQETGRVRNEDHMMHLKFKPSLVLAGGLSYEFDKNNNLSLNFSGNHCKRLQSASTHNDIYDNGLLTSSTDGYVGERRTVNQFEAMLNYYGELPIATLYGSLDYAFKEDNGQTNRDQTLGNGQTSAFRQDKDSYYHLFRGSFSADWKVAENHKINTSVNYVNWDNNNHYCQPLAEGGIPYKYLYKESSFDGSLGYEFSNSTWDVNVGTDYLRTNMKPLVVEAGQEASYERNVCKFLPFATITYVYNKAKYETVTLQYERTYDFSILTAMDPTTNWRSEYSYNKGNPNLCPGFTDKVALQTHVGKFSFRARFENELGAVGTYSLDDAKNEVCSYDNGMHDQLIFFYMGFPLIKFSKDWKINYYCCYNWKKSRYGDRKQVASQVSGGFTVMGTLPGNISLDATATLHSPQRSFYTTLYGAGDINCSLGKWFLKNKLYAGVRCNYSFLTRVRNITALYRSDSRYDRSMFMASFSVSYKFKWGNKRAWIKSSRVISSESMRMN